MTFTQELIQAVTMIPVFVVHMLMFHHPRTVAQSCIGMVHSVFSYAMHFNIWWRQQEWPDWAMELYIADKCLILAVVWGFHYHVEPFSARIVAVPVLVDAAHIAMFQHRYIGNRLAYYDVFMLSYILYVSAIIIFFRTRRWKLPTSIVLLALSMIGYGMDIHGLMHLCLTPGFWIWYEIIKARQEKNCVKEKKEKNAL